MRSTLVIALLFAFAAFTQAEGLGQVSTETDNIVDQAGQVVGKADKAVSEAINQAGGAGGGGKLGEVGGAGFKAPGN